MCGAQLSSALLLHVNLLLALYSGAALCTAARLKWDPSTYIAVRELFPREYGVACAALLASAITLGCAAHLALIALTVRRMRRSLLLLHAVWMGSLVALELSLVVWLSARIHTFLHSPQAAQLAEALELRDHLRPLLQYLGRWHPLPDKLRAIIEEAEADLPRNGYVAATAALLLVVLQVSAVVLAVLAARAQRQTQLSRTGSSSDEEAAAMARGDATLLKGAYKNGRLVLV